MYGICFTIGSLGKVEVKDLTWGPRIEVCFGDELIEFGRMVEHD